MATISNAWSMEEERQMNAIRSLYERIETLHGNFPVRQWGDLNQYESWRRELSLRTFRRIIESGPVGMESFGSFIARLLFAFENCMCAVLGSAHSPSANADISSNRSPPANPASANLTSADSPSTFERLCQILRSVYHELASEMRLLEPTPSHTSHAHPSGIIAGPARLESLMESTTDEGNSTYSSNHAANQNSHATYPISTIGQRRCEATLVPMSNQIRLSYPSMPPLAEDSPTRLLNAMLNLGVQVFSSNLSPNPLLVTDVQPSMPALNPIDAGNSDVSLQSENINLLGTGVPRVITPYDWMHQPPDSDSAATEEFQPTEMVQNMPLLSSPRPPPQRRNRIARSRACGEFLEGERVNERERFMSNRRFELEMIINEERHAYISRQALRSTPRGYEQQLRQEEIEEEVRDWMEENGHWWRRLRPDEADHMRSLGFVVDFDDRLFMWEGNFALLGVRDQRDLRDISVCFLDMDSFDALRCSWIPSRPLEMWTVREA
ncbi:hypothetical protein K470DRAFT_287994 [Piedraia hortae CBS 480.64]|uniref:Uncharacterized protein n=1 Tax=Piedraia hortae CBS 480.64 TaxID=1314780 RepID=A0A6A7BWG3_9PEZI|nr:hypothetical protein K470DRAFT_287994 [Piedraia hortae CBS 480.64]